LIINTADAYHARFRKVVDYIDAHLENDLNVAMLSHGASFSTFHFHRQFSVLFGIGVYKYIRLRRLKRASQQLAFRNDMEIIDIALSAGYESPESFARAFKKNLGQRPSEFRKRPLWKSWQDLYAPVADLRNEHMKRPPDTSDVSIVVVEETKVAVFEHRGDPASIGDSIRSFIAWRKQNQLPPQRYATFNILYDDPNGVAPDDFRLDLCVATDRDMAASPLGIVEKTLPGGRCAVLRHVGSDGDLGKSIAYLYAQWLPQSGEELRGFPLYLQRIRFFPDVPEHEAVSDLFLSLM
jgi:AraC family transcriptional regulator